MCVSKITRWQPSIPEKCEKGAKVENSWDIEWPVDPINASLALVEQWSVFPEVDLSSFILYFKWVVAKHSGSKLVINERAHENAWNFDNNLKSNKVNNAIIHLILIKQHVDIHQLRQDINRVSYNGDEKCNMWICEFTLVVDDVFHDCHRLSDLWEQHQVKSCCTNHFHQEKSVLLSHIDLVSVICHQNNSHAVH